MNTKLMSKTSLYSRALFLTALMTFVLAGCGGGNGAPGNPVSCSGSGTSIGNSSTSSSTSSTTTSCSSTTTTGTTTTGVVGSLQFVSALPANASIVFTNSAATGRTSTAVLTFEVLDTQGNALPNVAVTFTNNNPALGTLSPTSGTTNSSGQVVATVTAAAVATGGVAPLPGGLAIKASAKGASGTVTASSSEILVTTGTGIQAAMTMAPEAYSIEGLDWVGDTTKISFWLSDSNGNPVADGTPVAASTTEGGISGSSGSNPGCLTVNGQCSLTFTTQNPRSNTVGGVVQYGIATVTATSPNGSSTPLTSTITLTMSGSHPYFYSNSISTAGLNFIGSDGGQALTLGYGSTCPSQIVLFLSDEVGNPMAYGTTIAVTATNLAIGSVSPAKVPEVANFTALASSIKNYSSLPQYVSGGVTEFNGNLNANQIIIPVSGCTGTTGSLAFTITNPSSPGSGTSTLTTLNVTF